MNKTVTRRALYALVWAQPVTKVAARFKISDVALHKICQKNGIPTPPPGYWAKQKAGQKVKRKSLPPLKAGQKQTIEIFEGSPQQKDTIREARKKSEALRARVTDVVQEQEADNVEPSPFVEKLKAKLSKAKPKSDGLIHLDGDRQFNIKISPNTAARAASAIENIVNEALSRGYQIKSSEKGLTISVNTELVAFTLTETIKRVTHEPTEVESKRLKRWEEKREREFQAGLYRPAFDRPVVPEFDHIPTGRLTFEFIERRHCYGLRRRYSDGKRQRVEKLASKIVTAAAGYAAAIKEGREEDLRQKHEWDKRERIREDRERRQRLENKRYELLESKLERIKLAESLQEFVSKYEAIYARDALPESCQLFLDWALKTIETVHQEIHPDRLAEILEKHKLMDDSTDIYSWTKLDS